MKMRAILVGRLMVVFCLALVSSMNAQATYIRMSDSTDVEQIKGRSTSKRVDVPILSSRVTQTTLMTPMTQTIPLTPTNFLPLVLNRFPLETVFGVESADLLSSADALKSNGVSWTRESNVSWHLVEPTLGARNWSAMATLDAELEEATRLGLKTVLIIHGTPTFAQKYRGSVCGPIHPNFIDEFGLFVRETVQRYSAPPFNIEFFEIGNEPDAPLRYDDQLWGCWGLASEYYRGGRQYATALKEAYVRAKEANPNAKILVGGLLANCDVVNPPRGADCTWTRFFEGILREGGGDFFDGLSFHTYEYYLGAQGKWGNANWNSDYATTGPVLHAKAKYFKQVMTTYGLTDKFLMDTEVALLCWTCSPTSDYESTKAGYLAEMYAASVAEGLKAAMWYSYEGWLGSGLVNGTTTLPAMTALRVASAELGDAAYAGRVVSADVGNVSGVTGYKFRHGAKDIWLLRGQSGNRVVTFSSLPSSIFDALGNPISSTTTLTLTLQPLFVEWER
jgi:hypothetical protein